MERKLPEGWRWENVGNVIQKIPLTNIKLKQREYKNCGCCPVVDQGQAIIGGYTDLKDLKVPCELPVIVFGDHTKSIKYVDFEFVAGADGIKVLKPDESIDPKLFYYFIKSIKLPDKGYARHFQLLEKSQIPIPPTEIQRRIVAILDKAEETRRLRAQADELAGKLIQNVFSDLFGDPKKNPKGWKLEKLEELGEVSGGVTLNSQRRNNKTNLLPYLRVANVFRNKLDLSEVKCIHVSSQEMDRYLLKKDDVLIVEGHGNKEEIGRTSVWNEEIPICVHQNHIIKVRPNAQLLNPYYLSYFLNHYGEHGYFSSKSVATSGLNTININKVRDAKLPIPKLEIQQQFSEFVRRTEAICQNQRRSNNEIDNLFNTLVQKAFAGELVA